MKEEDYREKLLLAVYNILYPVKDRGMVTLVFRFELGNLINEDEDEILLELEEDLIQNGWINQDPRSRLLRPTEKLRDFIEG